MAPAGVAWQRAFEELHGVEADIAEHTDAGMTDPEIVKIVFREVVGREGSAAERAQAIGCYLKHLPDTVAESDGYRVMPGIEELLARLIEAGVLLGLVTGNIEAAAHIKLARGRLNRFFSFGGYGSDSADRTEVTEAALRRGALVSGGELVDGNAIAVGDTPRDVTAGHGAGIKVVGVATGNYSVDELAQAGADWAISRRLRRLPGLIPSGRASGVGPPGNSRPKAGPGGPTPDAPLPAGWVSGQRAAGLVDAEEAVLEPVARGAQVEAPDAHPFGAG